MNVRYAAVCCYFGKWPAHFQVWLSSCSYNKQIVFWLVTDIPMEGYCVPDNVKVCRMSFEEVGTRIQDRFPELQVCVNRPYKLCDFKTAYGYIFDDLFDGFDYWGYYDIDTIWGDIVKFIPENSDSHLIKIFPCGHLSFIRNIAPWNTVYELVNRVAGTPCRNNMEGKKVATWQECFSSPESHYYDEEGGLEPMFSASIESIGRGNVYSGVDFDNILPPWRFDHFYSINFPEKSHNLVYSYENGHLYRHYLQGLTHVKEEICYLHASKRHITACISDSSRFIIYPNRITKWREWSLLNMLIHGRPRRLCNLLRLIIMRASTHPGKC